jgi:hypothetical protein
MFLHLVSAGINKSLNLGDILCRLGNHVLRYFLDKFLQDYGYVFSTDRF